MCFFSLCPPFQPVPWVSSRGAQRDSARAVRDSAKPPSGEPRCALVDPDTCVLNPMLLTPPAQVSLQKKKMRTLTSDGQFCRITVTNCLDVIEARRFQTIGPLGIKLIGAEGSGNYGYHQPVRALHPLASLWQMLQVTRESRVTVSL